MAAGNYPIRFSWQAHSYGTPAADGEKPDEYAAGVNLWGGFETDESSGLVETLQDEQQEVRASIRFRNYPAVAPLDRLTTPDGDVWTVETVRRGSNEIVAEVTR